MRSDAESSDVQTPIAIIGMECLFPNARGLREYWRLLRRREDGVTEVPASHWSLDDFYASDISGVDMTYCRRGAFLSPTDFDPTEFGVPPSTLEAIDTAQLLSLVVAKAALADAGYGDGREFDRSRASVILGVTGTQEMVIPLGARLGHPIWRKAMQSCGVPSDVTESVVREISDSYVAWQENSFPGLLGNVVAGRIANRLNLRGTNCVVDAACASSLSAIHLSMMELCNGRTDIALTGGVDALNDIFMFMCFSKTQALSATGDARPFSKDADGTVIGEGVGMVVLKRLADAVRDGDRVYAVIRGLGTSSDGRSQSIYAPRSEGQAEALRDAYRVGGVDPGTIGLVEAHGTGTKVGDAVEFEALKMVYRESRSSGRWCALGSVKSQIGHTKAAAGVAGLIKSALALHRKVLPATIKVDEPNPKMEIEASPFYLNTETRPWIASEDHPRRSCVSAFGFGGSNFHMVLEEAPDADLEPAWDGSVDIVAMSAASDGALGEILSDWQRFVASAEVDRGFAYRAKQSRDSFRSSDEHRLVIVVERGADLEKLFGDAARMVAAKAGDRAWSAPGIYYGSSAADGSLAFVFPGQGSQYLGMGRDLVCTFPEARGAVAEAGPSLSDRIYPVPAFDKQIQAEQREALTGTDVAQPAIGAVGLGMLRVLERFGVSADAVAGHSYGELVALRAGGRIDDATLRALSALRGRLMADGEGDRGTMAAVQASPVDIDRMIDEEGVEVVLAHRNGPTQGILSGSREAIDLAVKACASRGWRTTPLSVSGAFHSELMSAAQERFRAALDETSFAEGSTPVYANRTSTVYPVGSDEAVRDLLAGQLVSPVDFTQLIENMYEAGVREFVEVGPKAVLTGLIGGILGDRSYRSIAMDAGGGRRCGLADLARVLAQLSASGRSVTLSNWEPDCVEPVKPKMVVPLLGVNYRAPQKRVKKSIANKPVMNKQNDHKKRVPRASDSCGEIKKPCRETGKARIAAPGASSSRTVRKGVSTVGVPMKSENGEEVRGVLQVVQEGLRAMQSLQQQTASAHERFLETQEQAQRTFQMVMESQQRLMERALGFEATPSALAAPAVAQPQVRVPTIPQPVAAPAPAPVAKAVDDRAEIERAVIEVISEATGYPTDAIGMEMELEEDLGIDRVRRVDVLSQLGRRLDLRHPLNGTQADGLTTLQDVVDYSATGVMPESHVAPDASAVDLGESVSSGASADTSTLEATLLDVVSQLTGYPVEMLDPDMDMEADLGIDSIKRVEILAEVQGRLPEMAAVDSSYMGSLRTLRNIMEYMANPDAGGSVAPCETACSPAVQSCGEEATECATLGRSVLRVSELGVACGSRDLSIAAGREVWIVDDGTELPRALSDKFLALDVPTRIVGDDAAAADATVGGVVYLAKPEADGDGAWSQEAEGRLKRAFSLARSAGPMLHDASQAGGAMFVTVSRMDGAFGLVGDSFDPVQGGLAGLAKTFAHEFPEVRCKALDVASAWDDVDAVADAIVLEMTSDGPVEVGLDGQTRRGLESVACEVGDGKLGLDPGDVVVVSGGARGVTAEAAHALAMACQPTLVLLGRSPAPESEPDWLSGLRDERDIKRALLDHAGDEDRSPSRIEAAYRRWVANREIAENIERCERAGSRVVYHSIDLRDAEAVRKTLDLVRGDVGPVRGLIHGAGVLADKRIAEKTDDQFDRVFDTKVSGLRHLLDVLDHGELKHLVLFSSVSGRFGRSGQVDYAMANEVLNKVAQRFRSTQPSWRVSAVNWGPWDGGMVGGALKREFERQGIGLIPLAEGARELVREMSRAVRGDVEMIIGAAFPKASVSKPTNGDASVGASMGVGSSHAAEELLLMFERRLDVDRHSFLHSHVVGGHPVLPVALMLEWLGHGALHDNPGLALHGFDDFRVLKGLVLKDGPRDVRVVASKAKPSGDGYAVAVELQSVHDGGVHIHARGRAVLVSTLPQAPVFSGFAADDGQPYGRSVADVYEEILFHGSDFHAFEQIGRVRSDGMSAHVRSAPPPASWMDDPLRSAWLGDPLVVDAGLQLGILWCYEKMQSVSLPSFGASYRQYQASFPSEGVLAVLTHREESRRRMTADVTFVDADSRVIARLEGFEWTVDPSLGAAFGRPAIAGAGS
jgi:acyl transferase domain-containing protein/NAD(P)-dependent dehydrogenase (short-subunit alcohol dehydrogenase family)